MENEWLCIAYIHKKPYISASLENNRFERYAQKDRRPIVKTSNCEDDQKYLCTSFPTPLTPTLKIQDPKNMQMSWGRGSLTAMTLHRIPDM